MHPLDIQHKVRAVVEPSVERLGYDVVAVEWLGGGYGRILRISIERQLRLISQPGDSQSGDPQPAPGITPEDCARVSEAVSPILDEADPIEGKYVLEISSPGIDRPVQRPQDYARFVGYRLKLRLIEGHPRRRYTGELRGLEDDEIVVQVDGTDHRIALDTVERANLVLSLDEYQSLAEARHDDQ